MNTIAVDSFLTYTTAIIVFFLGMSINRRVRVLQEYNIPEPVTGGLIAATFSLVIYLTLDVELSYELFTRDLLLVYFFTAIGINAQFQDLIAGGRPLFILLVLTLGFIVVQNIVGVAAASVVGLSPEIGLLTGSAALIGGHGTAIAWADSFSDAGVNGALEIGVASATLGLVIASLIGGPIAKRLIEKHSLSATEEASVVGIAYEEEDRQIISHTDVMAVILTIHIAILIGWTAHQALQQAGIKLPLFVTCLFAGILMTNVIPVLFKNLYWPSRSRSLALVSDFSLGLFLTMSLMSMQLWTIAGLAGPLLVMLICQTIVATGFIMVVLFPLMGRDYQAAVLSAGFGGFALGATPTAIANMTAVTKKHGPAPLAFIILPLVAAFFVDITNSFVLQTGLNWLTN